MYFITDFSPREDGVVDAKACGGHDWFAVVDLLERLHRGYAAAHVGRCVRLDGRVDA